MPFLNSVEFNFAFSSNQSGQQPQVSSLFLNLAAFGTWHQQNGFRYYNSISSFFYYGFDGTSNTINDGGFDMWDGGNCNSIFGTFTSTNLVYGTSFNDNVNKRGYYVSPPGTSANGNSCNQPFICLAYVNSGTITWNNAGDIGTDGSSGVCSNTLGTYTAASNRSGVWYANQNFNGGDPNICYLWFTVSQPAFSTITTNIVDGRKPTSATPPPNAYTSSFVTFTGSNLIVGQFLLSRYPTGFITPGEISTFLLRYVSEAPLTVSP
jgi:hypothetical protein